MILVYAIPGYLQVQLGEVVRLKQRIAVGGGGSVHLADIIDKRMIEKYGQKTAVVKLPLGMLFFSSHIGIDIFQMKQARL